MRSKNKVIRQPWVVWRVNDASVMVQIHEPSVAKTFAKLKGVTRAGYGVAGGYLRLFTTPMSVPEVEAWMKHQAGAVSAGRSVI